MILCIIFLIIILIYSYNKIYNYTVNIRRNVHINKRQKILLELYNRLIESYQLSKTKVRNYSFLVMLFLLLNPTLSLASICVGYESLAASGLLITLGLLIQDLTSDSNNVFKRNC